MITRLIELPVQAPELTIWYVNGRPRGAAFEHDGSFRRRPATSGVGEVPESSVFKRPDLAAIDAATRRLAQKQMGYHPERLHLGSPVSRPRGGWGVGGDLDSIALVTH